MICLIIVYILTIFNSLIYIKNMGNPSSELSIIFYIVIPFVNFVLLSIDSFRRNIHIRKGYFKFFLYTFLCAVFGLVGAIIYTLAIAVPNKIGNNKKEIPEYKSFSDAKDFYEK